MTTMTTGITDRLIRELAELSAQRHQLAREEGILREALRHSRQGRSLAVIAATIAEAGVDPRRWLGDAAP